jgi:superfamily II DNA or RNA helicase
VAAISEVVEFHAQDAVYARIYASPSVMAEIRDHFTFEAPGARFSPAYKRGHWDGRISLFKNKLLYTGLERHLEAFCRKRGYHFNSNVEYGQPPSDDEIEDFIESLNIPEQFAARDYQLDTFRKATEGDRALFLSPTSSGKSLMIYHLIRWKATKTLVIVPTVSLVHQLAGDFKDYGEPEDSIHTIAGGERWSSANITVTTWQSAVTMLDTPEWFEQFGMVIGDEAHRFAAKSLIAIMESLPNCHNRFGFTGSLDDSKCNALTLEGLFGPVHTVTTTRKLMDAGHVSDLAVNVVFLKHPEPVRKVKFKYQDEVNYLIGCKARNNFLKDLALNLDGNTLLLYYRIGDHGKPLYEQIKAATDRPVYFIHGGVAGEDRNAVRKLIEEQDNAIIVASVGTFSTGINIKRLHNIITASSWKSRVMNLQSIGRGLRKADDKERCNLYDIVDDMSWKKRKNYTLLHGEVRIKLYNEQEFDYTMHHLNLD